MASEKTLLMEAEHARTLLKAAVANQEPRGIRVRDRRLRGKARRNLAQKKSEKV